MANPVSPGTFLLEADRLGLAVSPFFREATVFVKHKSIEGGMGIHVFRWAAAAPCATAKEQHSPLIGQRHGSAVPCLWACSNCQH